MDSLLTHSDFIFDTQISISSDEQQLFAEFIAKTQADFLRKVLGVELYNAVVAAPNTFDGLLNGEDFTYSGSLFHFNGVTEILRYYVYVLWMQNNAAFTTGSGTTQPKHENSTEVSSGLLIVRAQNKCLQLCNSMLKSYIEDQNYYSIWHYTQPFENYYNVFGI